MIDAPLFDATLVATNFPKLSLSLPMGSSRRSQSQPKTRSLRSDVEDVILKNPNATLGEISKLASCSAAYAGIVRKKLVEIGRVPWRNERLHRWKVKSGVVTFSDKRNVIFDDGSSMGGECVSSCSSHVVATNPSSRNLADKYAPKSVYEIAGHDRVVETMKMFVRNPFSCSMLFVGPGGVGKSSLARSIAFDLGCVDEMNGLSTVSCSSLSTESVQAIFDSLNYKTIFGGKWKVIILEELDYLHPRVTRFLKVRLESMPSHSIVMATSNDVSKLEKPFLQRFFKYEMSPKSDFKKSCMERLRSIWKAETGCDEFPEINGIWNDGSGDYSMRTAMHKMTSLLMERKKDEKQERI